VLLAAKVAALRAGRANVAFADVRAAVPAALRHRLVLNFQGQADAADPDAILAELLADIPAT
jgi:MoxR-like ATPase